MNRFLFVCFTGLFLFFTSLGVAQSEHLGVLSASPHSAYSNGTSAKTENKHSSRNSSVIHHSTDEDKGHHSKVKYKSTTASGKKADEKKKKKKNRSL